MAALLLATLAVVGVQVALAVIAPGAEGVAGAAEWWLARHASFLFLPFIAAQMLVRRRVSVDRALLCALLAIAHADGRVPSREQRLDFVNFSGRWAITMALFPLAGGVLVLPPLFGWA